MRAFEKKNLCVYHASIINQKLLCVTFPSNLQLVGCMSDFPADEIFISNWIPDKRNFRQREAGNWEIGGNIVQEEEAAALNWDGTGLG